MVDLASLFNAEIPGWPVSNISRLEGVWGCACSGRTGGSRLCFDTVAGMVKVELKIDGLAGHGAIRVLAPYNTRFQLQAPKGWVILGPRECEGTGHWAKFFMSKENIAARPEPESANLTLSPTTGDDRRIFLHV